MELSQRGGEVVRKHKSVAASSAAPGAGAVSATEVEQAQYAAQFAQLDREAWYTLGAALLTTVVFWGAIFLTHDSALTVGYMPLWFVLSCLGGYVFSVVIVIALVKFCLKPCQLKVKSYHELHEKSQGEY